VKRVVIIGAGLGGLASALRCAHRGYAVTVLEMNDQVGGKMGIFTDRGYTFDTGPTLVTMPFVLLDLFDAIGRRLEDYLDLVPLEPNCRYFFPDGSRLDASSDRTRMADEIRALAGADAEGFERFLAHAESIYNAAAEPFLFSSFSSLRFRDIVRQAKHLPALARIDAFRTMNAVVSEFFGDGRLRQLFNRFATYNGSSPFRAPATLSIIPYVEFEMGGWYVRGGLYKIAETLRQLATEDGVQIRTSCEVTRIVHAGKRATGVMTKDGNFIAADAVICNADAIYAHEALLDRTALRKPGRFAGAEPSLAGFVMLLGVRKQFDHLAHHNIFFSKDYPAEFKALVDDGIPAPDPTIYVSISAKSDPDHAPEGCSNLFVLVNAPPLNGRFDWDSYKGKYRNLILSALGRFGLPDLESRLAMEQIITPADFERRFNAYRGSIYGTSSNNRMAAFLRPPNRSRDLANLFFAGGSSHPGGGIPLVLLSGAHATRLLGEVLG